MSRINDDNIYPPSDLVDGATVIGSLPSGETRQFTSEGMYKYVLDKLDIVLSHKANRAGQVIVGNLDSVPATQNNNINDGATYQAEILTFPFTQNSHLKFMIQTFD